ncbi:mechanosensitive ion channel family protein [Propionibacterium australiense]|uniref:Mechanosensitive ion channel MscS, C-terminal n=1 Tax=Propionibacterium australiense TaxID=119981 RepID=A0A383S7R2_9ACTN|nr:mechanosensitive ion channel family protein [Propionibacterium australiense]SYZ33602.1 Mechanosensitive ion channel MscS, C-terminal [Propionibacterium australiense]VEH88795.1 MscS family inner membrane protein YnaI [Propionibacterium australiense]
MLPLNIEFVWPNTLIEIVVTIAVAVVTRFVVRRLIDQFIKHAGQRQAERAGHDITTTGINTNRATQRAKTLGTVLKSITDLILIAVVVLTVLNSININVMPAIASAGVVGIAVAFGAQSLVKDFFNGICMIMEDQYGVGDIVRIDDIKGTVRAVGFRITEVQDINGQVWYLRNGEITTVGNISQGFSKSTIDIPVSVDENPGAVIKLLRRTCARMDAEPDWHNQMLEAPNVLGLSSLDENAAIYQILISCPADKQWSVEREIRSRILAALRRAGMHTPRRTILAVPSKKNEDITSAQSGQKRHPLSKAARDRLAEQAAGTGRGARPDADAPDPTEAGGQAPAPVPEPQAPGQQITAREWLEDSAGRNVRWVSASDTGHNMAAEETIAMDPTVITKQAGRRRRRLRKPGTQEPSGEHDQKTPAAQVLSADTTHQLPKVGD